MKSCQHRTGKNEADHVPTADFMLFRLVCPAQILNLPTELDIFRRCSCILFGKELQHIGSYGIWHSGFGIQHGVQADMQFRGNQEYRLALWIAAAKHLGLTDGVGNNLFAPQREITRQEMFTLLYNILKAAKQLPQADSTKALPAFSDAGQLEPWAKEAVTLLAAAGVIEGSGGKLDPTATATRAQMAQLLYKL